MKRFVIGCFIFALVLALGRHFYFEYQENEKLDAFIDAQLSGNMQVPLDCVPLGQLKVTFDSNELATPEIIRENISLVVKQWKVLWPFAYDALQKAAKDYNGGDKFSDGPEITVVLPKNVLSTNPDWTIEYTSRGGQYAVDITGLNVKSAKPDY